MKATRTRGRRTLLGMPILLLVGLAARADDEEKGFRPLFNGRDLSGWVKEGPAGFRVKQGKLICNGKGNYPTWLRSEEVFENFVLRLEYKLTWYGESGLFLHAPLHGRTSNVGFEVQLSDDTRTVGAQGHSSGAIFAAVPPVRQVGRTGVWNQLEIVFDWPKLRVILNGELVQDLDVEGHESLKHRPRFGYIGLQDRGKPVQFRNIRIKRLPEKDRRHWRPLFGGKDFDGWHFSEHNTAKWKVEDGQIVATGGGGYLITNRQFRNCELMAYVKSSRLANGGIFFRWKSLVPRDRGFEIQIEDIPDSNNPTGSIYDLVRATALDLRPGEWYPVQVFLKGPRCTVRVNGTTVAETKELPVDRAGHIALQMHVDDGWIRFKDLMLKPLK